MSRKNSITSDAARIFRELDELEEVTGTYERYDIESDSVILTLTSPLFIRVPRTTLTVLRSLESGAKVRLMRVDNRIMISQL